MNSLRSHLTVLKDTASLYPTLAAFKVPELDSSSGQVQTWLTITYHQFLTDVERFAKYWSHKLQADGIPRRSVVGLWIGGMTYWDVCHIYGMARAGYVPQLFSLRLPNPDVVCELLQRAGAKALVYEPTFESILDSCPLPKHAAINDIEITLEHELPELYQPISGDDLVVIFHTSGSTSGSPKLVRCNYTWLNSMLAKSQQVSTPKDSRRKDVFTWMGSVCHIAQTFMLMGSIQHAACTIQPTKIAFSSDELVDAVNRCGLNRLSQFATFLGIHIRNARLNPKLLAVLQSLDDVIYSGLPLPQDEEEWARRGRVNLRNLFGSTEIGAMMLSPGIPHPHGHLLRPLEGTNYGFFPTTPSTQTEAGHQSTSRMLELVILKESGDCPDEAMRHTDGHFHTGDLFQEIIPGHYLFRGRDDDWIKSENSLRCDTKAIEDNVRATCAEIITECIVVGNGRPSPALFVEPATPEVDQSKLKREILRNIRQFHARRYLHERITSSEHIVVVPPKTLPRTATKGNIRRKAVEEQYKDHLDRMFGILA
ncbi:hypothetical protein JAAARDRAFT_120174 [Jaapia argillacea MUCL 33604]|uniref:AMP-dependent synthetase/ligase domain-containing protein n=1 Tax=Jaapia argillacea MUCL 33604 TaxID=933084 RepID=A0A067QBT4_9AGAM|nr:hypothetical protein JAAARDRAFT_120174 [Jaapia argillacea MUCL 33604]